MAVRRSTGRKAMGSLGGAAAIGALVALSPDRADAHFILRAPEAWMSQDFLGNPQKLGPCGDDPGGTPTGTVTAYQAGQTITITINETVFHPGHYRIALAVNDRSELPPEPVVTRGSTACGSVPIDPAPMFPVLADGVLAHTRAFTGPQSVQVTLPSNVTCDHCTLQVIEFMSNHGLNNPGGCFYHHCADLSIHAVAVDAGAPDASTPVDAAVEPDATPASDAQRPSDAQATADLGASPDGGFGPGGSGGGCGCGVARGAPSALASLAALLALAVTLRRRRA